MSVTTFPASADLPLGGPRPPTKASATAPDPPRVARQVLRQGVAAELGERLDELVRLGQIALHAVQPTNARAAFARCIKGSCLSAIIVSKATGTLPAPTLPIAPSTSAACPRTQRRSVGGFGWLRRGPNDHQGHNRRIDLRIL